MWARGQGIQTKTVDADKLDRATSHDFGRGGYGGGGVAANSALAAEGRTARAEADSTAVAELRRLPSGTARLPHSATYRVA